MKNAALSLQVIRGAIKGALITLALAFVVISIVGFLYGYGGPFLAFYYAGWLILYIAPVGLLLGAIVTGISILKNADDRDRDTSHNNRHYTRVEAAVWIALPLIVSVGLVIAPRLLANVDREVKHGATWTTEVRPDCSSPAVILMLTEYAQYEIMCSPALFDYLKTQNDVVVPITYRVTYFFGEPRSYQLIRAGAIEISWSEWLGGPSGCGGEYTPPCDSAQARNGSPLYERSMHNEHRYRASACR